ncbi:hypothetical protein CerSpe_189820 [Prunus speciosa]
MAAPTTLVGPPELKQPVTSSPPPPQLQLLYQLASVSSATKDNYRSFGNPCHAIYLNYKTHRHLKQLLPLAWSHNPLTTLKLICSLLCFEEKELFYMAASWLFQNHPKTLACNVVPIAGALGDFKDILEVLYGILDVNAVRKRRSRSRSLWFDEEDVIQKKVGSGADISSNTRKKIIDMARKAVEMYERDPDYQLLHERVSDLYAECLESDIQNLKKYEKQKMENVNGPDKLDLELKLTLAAKWCPSVDSFFDRATLLCETIARKLFPRGECKKGNSVEEEEADYVSRVRERLMNEVLEPLRKVIKEGYKEKYVPYQRRGEDPRVKKYLMRVNSKKIEAGAMLPNQIISYVNDRNFGELAEAQWKAMVEEMYSKQGKFKNCLAVCDVSGRMSRDPMNFSLGLGLLVSELSEEPWKGKVFTFSRNPQLLLIQGDDLKSKCAFMRRMDNQDWDGETDFNKVFDLILEVAVKGNWKPEQMIKRLYVFTSDQDFDDASANSWKTDYQTIQSKFKEKGYGDVVFWDMNKDESIPVAHSAVQGVARMTGYSKNIVKCFLDNDGDVSPDHVMEAAISGNYYQNLAVVD